MDRRHFILALSAGAALLGAPPAHAECGGPSAVEFVEDLYQKQARLLVENAPPAEEDFLELFSAGMRALMQAPRWNKALLDNAARPSGALVYAGAAGASTSSTSAPP